MPRPLPRRAVLAGASLPALLGSGRATAQAWPNKPIRVIVSFPAGGSSDVIARLLAPLIGATLGQPMIVDNRPGAGGMLAGEILKREPADGHTFMLSNAAPFSISPAQFKRVPYDPIQDFTHVSFLGAGQSAIFVAPSMGVRDVQGFIAKAKAAPGRIAYGSSGIGSITHIIGEGFAKRAGIELLHVPYRGSAPAIQDFLGGQIPVFLDSLMLNAPMVRANQAIPVVLCAAERAPAFPEVPTMVESGIDLVAENWLGYSAPAGLPDAIAALFDAAVVAATNDPAVRARMLELGTVQGRKTRAEFSDFVTAQLPVWRQLMLDAGIEPT